MQKIAEFACCCEKAVQLCNKHEIFPKEKFLKEKYLQSFKFSKNLAEIQKQLQSIYFWKGIHLE
jgi:hypothetical protein